MIKHLIVYFCISTEQDKILAKLLGNATDHFKILDHDPKTILVGARYVKYLPNELFIPLFYRLFLIPLFLRQRYNLQHKYKWIT